VYYVPWDDKGIPEARLAVRTMQALKEVPWPEDTCIVVAEELVVNQQPPQPKEAPLEFDPAILDCDGHVIVQAVDVLRPVIHLNRSISNQTVGIPLVDDRRVNIRRNPQSKVLKQWEWTVGLIM
jgi:hypothetical protein